MTPSTISRRRILAQSSLLALAPLTSCTSFKRDPLKGAAMLDAHIPGADAGGAFLMEVEAVSTVSGRTVVTGPVRRGIVNLGDDIQIVGIGPTMQTVCTGLELIPSEPFRRIEQAKAGDTCRIQLRGIRRDEIERGQVLAKPGSITPHDKFECDVYMLTKEEGGRNRPFFDGYRPQFYFHSGDVNGSVELPEGTWTYEGTKMVMPGDNAKLVVTLSTWVAMEQGTRFVIREGGRSVGAGRVAKILR